MSPPGRAKGEYRSAKHEGTPVGPPGRPKGEYRSAKHGEAPSSRGTVPLARIAWLLGAVGTGLLVGLAVRALGGGDAGFLAVPAAVIAAWLRVADPSACMPRGASDARGSDDA